MKKRILTLLLLFAPLMSLAQELTVAVDTVGQLASQLPDSIRYTMSELKNSGPLNGNDLKIIQLITNRLKPRKPTDVMLTVLDLSDAPTSALLCCADVLLTDYSSVVFDAALLGVPSMFYCPNRADYERSFYLDFDRDLPGPVLEKADAVLPALRAIHAAPDRERLRAFCEKQMAACDGHATERVVSLIRSYLEK